jgi:hypothetical protein
MLVLKTAEFTFAWLQTMLEVIKPQLLLKLNVSFLSLFEVLKNKMFYIKIQATDKSKGKIFRNSFKCSFIQFLLFFPIY